MARVERALVVGGGIGGLSSAIALRRAGIDVDLVEINRDWKVYHIGIVVQANFIRAMAALGIADEAIAAGFPYSGLSFQDLNGNVLKEIKGHKLAGEQGGVAQRVAALTRALDPFAADVGGGTP